MTVLVSRDDIALAWSSRIAGARQRVGTLNVDDPRVQEAALKAKLRIIDVSNLKASDAFNHDRYASLAALYRRLAVADASGAGQDLRRAGAFIFNAVGTTLSSPFGLAGSALAGE
jgi:esterase/lipase superfamily enzyme